MAKRVSRVQKTDRSFGFEKEATLLVRALNDDLGPAAKGKRDAVDFRALKVLVKRFQQLEEVVNNSQIPLFSLGKDRGIDSNPEVMNKYVAINRFLGRYVAVPVITPLYFYDANPISRGWEFSWARTERQQPFFELGLVKTIVEIAQAHRISSLKQCEHCRRWLFARFSHQRFCGVACKESYHRSDAADKQRRREWARKNYWLHKNRNIK